MGNSRGAYRTTRANKYRAYERLPREVRDALKEAISDYVPQPLVTLMKQGASAADLVTLVRAWDEDERAQAAKPRLRRVRAWAPDRRHGGWVYIDEYGRAVPGMGANRRGAARDAWMSERND